MAYKAAREKRGGKSWPTGKRTEVKRKRGGSGEKGGALKETVVRSTTLAYTGYRTGRPPTPKRKRGAPRSNSQESGSKENAVVGRNVMRVPN